MKNWLFILAASFATVAYSDEGAKENIEAKLKHLTEQKEQLAQMMDDLSSQKDISADEKEALNDEFLKTQKQLDESITELKSSSQ